jgi:type II secretory pathway pseudopilin PulG
MGGVSDDVELAPPIKWMALMCSFFMALAVLHLDCFDSKQARAQILSKFWHQPCLVIISEVLMFCLKVFETSGDQELKVSLKTLIDIGVETSVTRLPPERQEPHANGAIGSQKVQDCRGFTVLETLVVVMFIGIVASILIPRFTSITQAATTVKCAANLLSFAEEIELIYLDSPVPSQADLGNKDIGWPNGKWKDYWYVPNNKDFNSGHGNDLDGCDEENPGKSTPNRECIPMRFLIVCKHQSHGDQSDAKYLFITDMYPPQIVPFEEYRHTYLLDAKWWPTEDPGFDAWIGKTPTH